MEDKSQEFVTRSHKMLSVYSSHKNYIVMFVCMCHEKMSLVMHVCMFVSRHGFWLCKYDGFVYSSHKLSLALYKVTSSLLLYRFCIFKSQDFKNTHVDQNTPLLLLIQIIQNSPSLLLFFSPSPYTKLFKIHEDIRKTLFTFSKHIWLHLLITLLRE